MMPHKLLHTASKASRLHAFQPLRSLSAKPWRETVTELPTGQAPETFDNTMWTLKRRLGVPEYSLLEPLPGVPPVEATAPYDCFNPQVSKLSNGVTVGSAESHNTNTRIFVYTKSGSRHENADESGVAALTRALAFASNKHNSRFRMIRDFERMGASFDAAGGRDDLVYEVNGLREHASVLIDRVGECVSNTDFFEWETNEVKANLAKLCDKFADNGEDLLHQAAFGSTGLGNSPFPSKEALARLTHNNVSEFKKRTVAAEDVVIGASGISHEDLVRYAESAFADLQPGKASGASGQSPYKGGDVRTLSSGNCEIEIGFPLPSADDPNIYEAFLLQTMLGGGASFSAGGPGKGMFSRLFRNFLNRVDWVESAQCNLAAYRDTGLLSVQCSVNPDAGDKAVELVAGELSSLRSNIEDEEFERAKTMLTSNMLFNLESDRVVAEDICRQLGVSGRHQAASHMVDQINNISKDSIHAFSKKMLSATPSVAIRSSAPHKVPRFEDIAKMFQ